MGLPLKALTTLSILSLAHSIYSACEATTLPTPHTSTPSPSTAHPQPHQSNIHIPLDIRIQTLISTFLLLICIVLSAPELRPIRWNEWAGRIEREGWDPNASEASRTGGLSGKGSSVNLRSKGGAGNPYQMLELRRGFWDVRGSRERFAGWVRSGEGR